MKKIKVLLLLVLTLALVFTSTCYFIFADDDVSIEEATLTVKSEGSEDQVYSGTLAEMIVKLKALASSVTDIKTVLQLDVNKDCSFETFAHFTANEYVTVNFNINGHKVFCTKTYIVEPRGAMSFNIDGSDDNGNLGTIIITGTSGAVVYTHKDRASAQMAISIKNINLVYTNLSDGFSTTSNNSMSQSMTHFQAGVIDIVNVNMIYTGEDAKHIVGATDKDYFKDFANFAPSFIYSNSSADKGVTVNLYNCKLIDTRQCEEETPVSTRAIFAGNYSTINVYNSEIDSFDGVSNNYTTSTVNIFNSDIKIERNAYTGKGSIHISGTTTEIAEGGTLSDSSSQNHVFHYNYDKPTLVFADKLTGTLGGDDYYELREIKTGVFEVIAKSDYEAILTVTDAQGNETITTGTLSNLVQNLGTTLNDNTQYRLVLFKDTSLTKVVNIKFSQAGTKIIVDFNGYNVALPASSIFSCNSSSNVTFDGANSLGERSVLTCNKKSGAFLYTSTDVSDLFVTVKNIHFIYSNLSQGYCENNADATYANQPMMHLKYGKILFDNIKIDYTGADAVFSNLSYAANNEEFKTKYSHNGELATDISWLQTSFIKVYMNTDLVVKDCEFNDTNTKGIRTSGINTSGNAKIELINSKILAFDGIVNSSSNEINVRGCDITGNHVTYSNAKNINIYDSISRIGSVEIDGQTSVEGILVDGIGITKFYFGDGKNLIYSNTVPAVSVEEGFKLSEKSDGVYEIVFDIGENVDTVLTITEQGKEPVVSYGKYTDFISQLSTLSPEVPTTYSFVLYSNVGNLSSPVNGCIFNGNENVTLKIDLNGFDLYLKSNYSLAAGSFKFDFDGADVVGNKGNVYITNSNSSFIITSNGATDAYSVNLSNVVINVLNYIDNQQKSRQNVIHLRGNSLAVIENTDVVFSGDNATYTENGLNELLLVCSRTTVNVKISNSSFVDLNDKGIKVYGVGIHNNSTGEIVGCQFNCDYPINTLHATTFVTVSECNVIATGSAFVATGNIDVVDSMIDLTDTVTISEGSGVIRFVIGDGKSIIKANVSSIQELTGSYIIPDNYLFYKINGCFELIDGAYYYSTARPSAIIGNNMVYQRDEPINVYGVSAGEGNKIIVTLSDINGNVEIKDTVVSDGRWFVSFDARTAQKGLSLSLIEEAPLETKEFASFTGIDIGDVWFVGGQSNAAYELFKMEDSADYIRNADNFDNIRVYSQTHNLQIKPDYVGGGVWNIATSEFLENGDVSAIGYVMATRIAAQYPDLTVAVVDVNFSGSAIQCWIDEEEYIEEFGASDAGYLSYKAMQEFYNEYGRLPTNAAELSAFNGGKYASRPVISIYNAMIKHLEGYFCRGVVWYQGCSNVTGDEIYHRQYSALLKSWRSASGNDDTPFFVVQLAPYTSYDAFDFRSAQYLLKDVDSNTYIINAHTEGNLMNKSDLIYSPVSGGSSSPMVHPSRKSPVGNRLADSVLKNVYGLYEDRIVEAPEVLKVEYVNGRVLITFDTNLSIFYGDSVEGFELAGADGVFYAADAIIENNSVILTSDSVDAPVTVRYGYGAVITIELIDGTLIKAAPGTKDGPHTNNKNQGYVVIVDEDGVSHTIYEKDNAVIRSFIPGNITNASGHPLFVFKLDVGYGLNN